MQCDKQVFDRQTDRQTDRLNYIQGIRAIASLSVLFHHLCCVFIPNLCSPNVVASKFEKLWYGSPLNVFTNGNAWVLCFFVLSGFLIARKNYLNKSKKLLTPVYEYMKLLKLVIPAVGFSFILMCSNQMYHLGAMKIDSSLIFVSNYNNFKPSFWGAFKETFIGVFVQGSSSYDSPLWTMRYELLGTVLVSIVSHYAFSMQKQRKLFYVSICLLVACCMPQLIPFLMGAYAFDYMYAKEFDDTLLGKISKFLSSKIFLFGVGIYFFCVNSDMSGLWYPLGIVTNSFSVTLKNYFIMGFRSVGITLLLIGVSENTIIQYFLQKHILMKIGDVSSYIYIFHWPIILSLGCGVYVALRDIKNIKRGIAVLIVIFAVVIVTIAFSTLYALFVKKCERKIKNIVCKLSTSSKT